jgi:hypothetical protein
MKSAFLGLVFVGVLVLGFVCLLGLQKIVG